MTTQQATEIREHLIRELNANGFSDIVTEINTRLEEDYEEKEFERSPTNLLIFFLRESIDILSNISNKNYDGLIGNFNEFVSGNSKVEKLSVELLNQGKDEAFDLRNLPDYKPVSIILEEILNEIMEEN